jgi:hypothetical protein
MRAEWLVHAARIWRIGGLWLDCVVGRGDTTFGRDIAILPAGVLRTAKEGQTSDIPTRVSPRRRLLRLLGHHEVLAR